MIRFKVIKGSHLLLTFAVIVLLAVIGFILLQGGFDVAPGARPSAADADIVQNDATGAEARAAVALASSTSAMSDVPSTLQIEVVADAPSAAPAAEAPTVLIYHTHTHEAYAQDSADPYEAVETWRTVDEQHSVVRVGTALAEALTELGYNVTHDTTDHELEALSTAYERSLATLERYDGHFDLRIDLHRDAYVDGLQECYEGPDGLRCAQLMLLVGRGDGYSGAERPPYEENLAFAQRLTWALNERMPGICRNVTVKKGRYNQHVDERCILVEVGHNLNTLREALAAVPTLAQGIDDALRETAQNIT